MDDLEILLEEAVAATLFVTGPEGSEAGPLVIRITDPRLRPVNVQTHVPDREGRIDLEGVTPGNWLLFIDRGGQRVAAGLKLVVPGEPVTVTLDR